jgi:murein DD-endopeptidase MepM/ murein hydrolase activator NlpD
MNGKASNLQVLLGVQDLPTFFTKLQIIQNLSRYDKKLLNEFEDNLRELESMNSVLSADKQVLDTKETALSDQKSTLAARQADIESSQYVLDLKKEISQHKYEEAVAYFKTLDETSSDYNAMLNMLSKEQDKVDAQINSYLLKYGSSADDPVGGEGVTNASGDGESITGKGAATTTPAVTKPRAKLTNPYEKPTSTTAATELDDLDNFTFPSTTSANISPESIDLIWPLPYNNCYISAYYGQYPSGGPHHGVDMCVRGGTEGKKVVAAGSGRVISYGFNHWSMGNYVIIDHGHGLFTAYYHLQKLYVEQGDTVSQGQVIGLAGHTGNTTGPHLHFEVRVSRGGVITRMNPLKFVSLPG